MKTAFCSMFAMILFVGDPIVAQEVSPAQVVIQTAAPALSPEEIERQVTVPIEEAVRDIPGLQSMRSQSAQGISVIMAQLSARNRHVEHAVAGVRTTQRIVRVARRGQDPASAECDEEVGCPT